MKNTLSQTFVAGQAAKHINALNALLRKDLTAEDLNAAVSTAVNSGGGGNPHRPASGLNSGKHLGRLFGLSRPSYLAGLILAVLLLAACGGGGSSSSGGGGGPQVYQVSGATVVGGLRNVTINWRNPAVGAGNVTAVNITYQIVSVNGPANDRTTLLLNDNRHLLSDGTTVITETLVQVEPARYTFTIEPVLGGALINATTRAVVFPNVNVIADPNDTDGDGIADTVDVDADGDGLIEIYNATQLNMMRNNLEGTSLKASMDATGNNMGCGGGRLGDASACNGYEQMANIDLNDLLDSNVVAGAPNWVRTGFCTTGGLRTCNVAESQFFVGTFDGNDYNISNMRINYTGTTNGVGFFGGIGAGSELRNMHIRNGSIISSSAASAAFDWGGLVGYATGARIISSSVTMEKVQSARTVGGLVGYCTGESSIISSYAVVSEIALTGSQAGGLVGSVSNCRIIYSLSITNHIEVGFDGIGGLVGDSEITSIVNSSYAVVGNMTSNTNPGANKPGGLISTANPAIIENSYAVVNNSITGNGGLVGSESGLPGRTGSNTTNSYWDNTTLTPSATTNSIGTGQPTTALQSGTSTSAGTDSIFSEWDQGYCNPATGEFSDSAATGFVLAWDLGTDTEYPALNCFSTFSPAQQRETAARALRGETLVE